MQTHTETPATETTEAHPEKVRRWHAPLLLAALVAVLGGLLLLGILPRSAHAKALKEAAAPRLQIVAVAIAAPGDASTELLLPSSVEASQEAPLYPRVSGYVKRIAADIGAKVNAGDVLAEIETPELDQQVNQARAAVEQAAANEDLAQVTYARWQEMQKARLVANQEVDERRSAAEARKADRAAADANLKRLTQMQGFQKITAPFAGTVTRRLVEVGQLVTGDLNDATRILFHIERTSQLRAFVNVPQSYYRNISTGQRVDLTFRERPGRFFPGNVVRTAGALDPATRTLRTEIQIPNETGELIPGLYAEVRFKIQRENPLVTVPARALITQSKGPQVATVDAQNQVALHAVTLGRDFGKIIEIESGLDAGTRFILNPTDTLRDGTAVQIEATVPAKLPAK